MEKRDKMTDVEGLSLLNNNPYRGNDQRVRSSLTSTQQRQIQILKRLFYSTINIIVLRHFNVYHVIMQSPHVRHEWFKIGLACSIALLSVKAYMEIFEAKLRKKKVDYTNYRQLTHLSIVLIIASSISFNVALWPHYEMNSLIVLGCFGFGVLLQLALIIPSWLQNALSLVALTYFLQVYK